MNTPRFHYNYLPIKDEMFSGGYGGGIEAEIYKLHEELAEVVEAYGDWMLAEKHADWICYGNKHLGDFERDRYYHFIEELCDLQHVGESLMRKLNQEDVKKVHAAVIEKNRRRGYYKED